MEIALLSAEYPPTPGGVGDYTRCLGVALAARGHHISVITGDSRQTRLEIRRLAIERWGEDNAQLPVSQSPNRSLWSWRSWREIIAALDELRPHVLHIQYQTGAYGMHPAINLLPWRLRGLAARPLVVVTFHDLLDPYLFPKAGPLRHWVTLRLARDADAVVVTNEEDARTLQIGRSVRAQVCSQSAILPLRSGQVRNLQPAIIPIGSNIPVAPPPGYRREDWRARLGLRSGELLVAYFGLLAASKGVDVLLEALARAPDLSARLLIIGGAATAPQDRAYAAAITARIARAGLGDRVTITGQVAPATVSAHLLAADCVALPFRDGASFRRGSLLAALAHGCAVVTTEHRPGTADAEPPLHNGEHALLIPPGSSDALAAALHRLAGSRALRDRLSAGARRLSEQFGWPAIVSRHEALYEQCSTLNR